MNTIGGVQKNPPTHLPPVICGGKTVEQNVFIQICCVGNIELCPSGSCPSSGKGHHTHTRVQ